MEDLGTYVSSDIKSALETILHGKETPEEREEALISFLKDYDKSVKEYESDMRTKVVIKNSMIVSVAIIALILGAMITWTLMKF